MSGAFGRFRGILLSLIVLGAGWTFPFRADAEDRLLVGVSSADVNPPEGICMGGYDRNRRTTGVHDNLYAKAVVFDDGKTPVALVVVDAIGIPYTDVAQIRAKASSQIKDIPLPPERILVSATHSHSAPDMTGIWGEGWKTGRDPGYVAQLTDTAANQVVAAVKNRRPAKLLYAETKCTGWAVNVIDPGVYDFAVPILECVGEDGKPFVTLTNYACHPTILDSPNHLASADWIGYFYTTMARNHPGEHIYIQGSVGGWVQPFNFRRTWDVAEKYGSDLARKVLDALENAKPLEGTGIRFANKPLTMRLDNPVFRLAHALDIVPGEESEGGLKIEVAWFSVGTAQFATHPGETSPAFSLATKALMKSGPKFIIGLGLDQLGYIIEKEKFGTNPFEYNSTVSVGPETGPCMMEALKSIIP